MNIYKRALELKEETIAHRRWFHTNAEIGLNMPNSQNYVLNYLACYGINAEKSGHGIIATIGSGKKVILLRADMDALPMQEDSGLAFACRHGAAHTCGHDFHVAMLLTAARILKENELNLKGTVKLMFQPAEETLEGAKDMINAGILEAPRPNAALAFHVTSGQLPIGYFFYNNKSSMMYSVDNFQIHIQGKGTHGAYPHKGIDPINIGAHILLALQELTSRECDASIPCICTIGHFEAGATANIIPDTALLEGTIRSNNADMREFIVRRMKEIAKSTAELYGGSAHVQMLAEVPPLICAPELTKEMIGYMKEVIPNPMPIGDMTASASEDFALIAEKIPSTMIYLSAGFPDERGDYPAHNPKVQFNENVCPIGAASYAYCAMKWLENNEN